MVVLAKRENGDRTELKRWEAKTNAEGVYTLPAAKLPALTLDHLVFDISFRPRFHRSTKLGSFRCYRIAARCNTRFDQAQRRTVGGGSGR